ncbi:MAG: lipopolysaccharide biosynthesis protein, partial [Caulobacteraceae bacterium]|nr:lipopolysaccharide biosynthesis protein [Caulobacter sp.]
EIARSILRYAMPIVTANVLYMGIPLANRSLIAVIYGFSETGQFSLAFDIGSKAVQAIGSTLDVLLFQLAVAVHERHGHHHARQRVADNMAITIAVIAPACAGIWLVLPSLQALIVPQQYRGPFAELLTDMMPGLFCFAMILYVINPIFQIAKRTAPLIGAAIVGCIADPAILLALPRTADASRLAIAQSGAFACAMIALVVIAGVSKPVWPRARDLAATALATLAMVAALLPLRESEPGVTVLAMQIVAGVGVYGALVMLLDIAGLRAVVMGRLRPSVASFRAG